MTSLDEAVRDVSILFLDTAPVIYYTERVSRFFPLARPIFRRINAGELMAVTSPITLAECLVHPYQQNKQTLTQQFTSLIKTGPHTRFVTINAEIADQAARLRARYNLRLPDALQVATAVYAGCDAFLTNDTQLQRVQELRVIVLEEISLSSESDEQ